PLSCSYVLSHYGEQCGVFVMGTREFATGEQRYPQGDKIVRTDLVVFDTRFLFRWRLVAVNRNRRGIVCSIVQRSQASESGGFHPRQRPDARNQLLLKSLGVRHVISRGDQ